MIGHFKQNSILKIIIWHKHTFCSLPLQNIYFLLSFVYSTNQLTRKLSWICIFPELSSQNILISLSCKTNLIYFSIPFSIKQKPLSQIIGVHPHQEWEGKRKVTPLCLLARSRPSKSLCWMHVITRVGCAPWHLIKVWAGFSPRQLDKKASSSAHHPPPLALLLYIIFLYNLLVQSTCFSHTPNPQNFSQK